jgi:hypothetical protein
MRGIHRYIPRRGYRDRRRFRYAGRGFPRTRTRTRRRNPFDPSLLISFRDRRRNVGRNPSFSVSGDIFYCGCPGCSNEVTQEDALCFFCKEAGCQFQRGECSAKNFQGLRRNIDPRRLTAFKGRRNMDLMRLTALRRRRNIDPMRLTALRRRRNLDTRRLTSFRGRRNLDPRRLTSFRGRRNLDPTRLTAFRRNPIRYRRNPCPEGKPWGPDLYNPLKDTNNKFKNERHYARMISKLRRNPW